MKYILLFLTCFGGTCFANDQLGEAKNVLKKELGIEVRAFSTQDFGRAKYHGALSVLIPEENSQKELYRLREKLPEGILAFIGTTRNLSGEDVEGVELVVIESTDKFDILRTSLSDGTNYDITNEIIIEKFQAWDKQYNIDIWQAETDTIQLTLKKLPEDLKALSLEIYEFCPDIVDQGSGDINDIVEYLTEEKAIFLWWD